MAETMLKNLDVIPVRFLVPDTIDLERDYPGFEVVSAPSGPGLPELPPKPSKAPKRGGWAVKVEITGTLAEKLRAYTGSDSFVNSVKASFEKWGKLSPGQIFWLEKKLGTS